MNAANILVVDDEADIRSLIEEILSDEGYAVRTAADAEGYDLVPPRRSYG